MTPGEWARLKGLFEQALDLDPAERNAFLTRACGEDASLLADVESLLASYEPDETASAASPDGSSPHGVPLREGRIDRYEIIRPIGAGGMGVVYLATRADQAYEKQVAIKVVHTRIESTEILSRFVHERQILATLDHPHIAKLLDGGTTDDGLPYLVMDCVEGTRIDEYCDDRALSIPRRVGLFLDVCSAVQYVHQNLVVHRDLKPSNILVTADGVPKLLDFGIAKLLKPDVFASAIDATRADFRILTPRYASPEQVRGEPITTATDVYSLGVILYELLTAHRPYEWSIDSPIEIARAVCEHQPERPSTIAVRAAERREGGADGATAQQIAARRATVPHGLKGQLRGDLDAIVLKALRKEPQRRYGSVEQLSEDLRRHVQGLPVLAHADSWSYRTGKFVRRHRTGVAAAALIAVSLVAGVASTAWQARVARAEHARAERQFNDVRRLSTSFLFEFHSAIQNLPGSTPARQLLVQRALEYLRKLAEEARTDRRLQHELAEAYLKVGDVQGNVYTANLGDTEGAARSYHEALRISTSLLEVDPHEADAKCYAARSYISLGEVLPQLGRPAEAMMGLRRAAAILESSIAETPSDPTLREQLARCYQVLGDLQGHSGLQNQGDPAGALDSYHKSLALYQELAARGGRDRSVRRGLALVDIRIGDMLEFRDDLDGALRAYRQALQISDALAAGDPANTEDRRRLALAHRKVGGIEEDLGHFREALNSYARAASINENLMNADPANVQAAMGYAISLRWTGDLLKALGDRPAALVKYQAVIGILEPLSRREPSNVTVRGRYAEILVATGRLLAAGGPVQEARRLTARGLSIARELASRPEATPDDLSQYALDFLTCEPPDLREPATALRYAEASVAKSGGTDSDNLDILAQAYFENGNVAEAIETENKALRLLAAPAANQPSPLRRRRLEAQLARFTAGRRRA
jgi:non-specific serine/threonine protein kinase/serine/threonine-protein kinase